MTNNFLNYSGYVTFEYRRSKKIKKNSGTIPLFSFLNKALLGQFDSSLVPFYIMMYSGVDLSSSDSSYECSFYADKEILYDFYPITAQFSESSLPLYTFSLSEQMLKTGAIDNSSDIYVALVSRNKQNILAYVKFDGDLSSIEDNNARLLISWTMLLENKE